MQERLFQLLVKDNEISWKSIIYDLIRKEEMDPWNIDVSLLSKKYIEHLKTLKNHDLKLSGKVLLAAAMLLRIKSKRLVGEDLNEFDRLLASTDVDEEQFYDELEAELKRGEALGMDQKYELFPRTPQPRKRKVSVYDLVLALEKALEVKKRRVWNSIRDAPEVKIPEKKFDISAAISTVFARITAFLSKGVTKLTFAQIVPSDKREDKVHTFIPLLYLSNQEKITLHQDEPFGEITIEVQPEKGGESV